MAANRTAGLWLVLTTVVVGAVCTAVVVAWPGWLLVGAYVALVPAGLVLHGSRYTVWVIGVLAVVTPPALLLLGMQFAPDDRTALRGLLFLYCAGMLGGLVLELLQQKRYVLEKPSIVDASGLPCAKGDIDRRGATWHLGFLSRLLTGGLAGAVFVTLIDVVTTGVTFERVTQPAPLMWAVVAGSVAPAVWKKVGDSWEKRERGLDELQAAMGAAEGPPALPAQKAAGARVSPQSENGHLAKAMRGLS